MALVAAQWILVPQPQQRAPTVTESEVVVEAHIPRAAIENNRIIVDAWRTLPTPQRGRPTATLPAEAFDNPPIETRRRSTMLETVAASWRLGPQPHQKQSHVIDTAFLSFTSDGVSVGLWDITPPPQQRAARAILPAEAFDNPPLGLLARQYQNVIVDAWRKVAQPTQRRAVVTEEEVVVAVFVPFTRERVVTRLWHIDPEPQQRIRNATLPAEVFDNPPVETRQRSTILPLVARVWTLDPMPQRSLPTATLPAQVFDDPPLGHLRRLIGDVVREAWALPPMPQRAIPTLTAGVLVPDICGPLFSALVDPRRISSLIDPERVSALVDPKRISDLECD